MLYGRIVITIGRKGRTEGVPRLLHAVFLHSIFGTHKKGCKEVSEVTVMGRNHAQVKKGKEISFLRRKAILRLSVTRGGGGAEELKCLYPQDPEMECMLKTKD